MEAIHIYTVILELIAMGEELSAASFLNLRTNGEFLPVSPSFLGAEFVENTEFADDVIEGVQAQGDNMDTA
jgi:hypothetical protein